MVHALEEARRVLRPGGLLIDLRPAPVHRRVGITRGGRWTLLGVMQEKFDDDHAANRAVAEMVRNGRLGRRWRTQFDCPRVMDSPDELRDWLDEFVQLGNMPPHGWLVDRAAAALARKRRKYQIVVHGPLILQVLLKGLGD